MAGTIPRACERMRLAEASGKTGGRAGEIGEPTPRGLLTERACATALIVLQAIGGSTNGIVHLAAMAGRAGITLDLDAFDALSKQVPVLIDLSLRAITTWSTSIMPAACAADAGVSDILDLDARRWPHLARSHEHRRTGAGQTVIRSRRESNQCAGRDVRPARQHRAARRVIKQSAASPS